MKVTIQNGVKHGFSRKEMEILVDLLPNFMTQLIKSIVLCQGIGNEAKINFHPKERILSFYWPPTTENEKAQSEAIDRLLVALSIIAEREMLPDHISKSLSLRYLEEWKILSEKCKMAIQKSVI